MADLTYMYMSAGAPLRCSADQRWNDAAPTPLSEGSSCSHQIPAAAPGRDDIIGLSSAQPIPGRDSSQTRWRVGAEEGRPTRASGRACPAEKSGLVAESMGGEGRGRTAGSRRGSPMQQPDQPDLRRRATWNVPRTMQCKSRPLRSGSARIAAGVWLGRRSVRQRGSRTRLWQGLNRGAPTRIAKEA